MNKIINNSVAFGFVLATTMTMSSVPNMMFTYDMQNTIGLDKACYDSKENSLTTNMDTMCGTYNGIYTGGMFIEPKPIDICQMATDIFGDMSSMTKDEAKSYSNVLEKMSKPTGYNLFEMM